MLNCFPGGMCLVKPTLLNIHLYEQQGITSTEATAMKRATINIYVLVAGAASQVHKDINLLNLSNIHCSIVNSVSDTMLLDAPLHQSRVYRS